MTNYEAHPRVFWGMVVAVLLFAGGLIALSVSAKSNESAFFRPVGICYRGKATARDAIARLKTADGEIVITFPTEITCPR